MNTGEELILAIRVRGQVKVRPQIQDTLTKLSLHRLHHARVLRLTPSLKGMVTKVKDYITWGEPSEEILSDMLMKRGRLPGNGRITDDYVKKNSKFKSVKAFAKALAEGKADVSDIEGLKPVFRLTPPSKGFRGKKTLPVGMGGITGYRGTRINDLAKRMI